MLTKRYRLIYAGGKIINADWDQPQTGYTWPGDGVLFLESDSLADLQALVASIGLTVPVGQNSP